jgi:hypothetical protein
MIQDVSIHTICFRFSMRGNAHCRCRCAAHERRLKADVRSKCRHKFCWFSTAALVGPLPYQFRRLGRWHSSLPPHGAEAIWAIRPQHGRFVVSRAKGFGRSSRTFSIALISEPLPFRWLADVYRQESSSSRVSTTFNTVNQEL